MTGIISRAEWGAQYRNGFGARRVGSLDKVLHHTVMATSGNPHADARAVERVGQSRFGGGTSYTFLVHPTGLIFEGLGVDRIGAHTTGHNTTAAAISLMGNFDTNPVPQAMQDSIVWLLQYGVGKWWQLPTITWGHRQLKGTACPGRHAFALIPTLNARASGSAVSPVVNPVTPAPAPKQGRDVNQSRATQLAVRAASDGYWGDDTERRVNLVREAINGRFTQGVAVTQSVVGTAQDGVWGPKSKAALKNTVAALQRAWGTGADGIWGPKTEAAWVAARARNYKNW